MLDCVSSLIATSTLKKAKAVIDQSSKSACCGSTVLCRRDTGALRVSALCRHQRSGLAVCCIA